MEIDIFYSWISLLNNLYRWIFTNIKLSYWLVKDCFYFLIFNLIYFFLIMGLSANRYILLSFIVSISFIILGGILIPVFKMVTRERMKKVCRTLQTLFMLIFFFIFFNLIFHDVSIFSYHRSIAILIPF